LKYKKNASIQATRAPLEVRSRVLKNHEYR
jgi:hypothetical protein